MASGASSSGTASERAGTTLTVRAVTQRFGESS
jgi:hypothetical protein